MNLYAGIFKITQARRTAEVRLVQALRRCKPSVKANAARKRTRRLWGDGKGRFRTQGRYSSATVRGTRWLVHDSCAGTLTRVAKGKVSVRDRVRRETVLLKAGEEYLAAPAA